MTSPRFFFDRCCPPKLATLAAVVEGTQTVRHFNDDARFVHDTPDVEWIGELGRDTGWVIVSMDARILKRPHERRALEDSKLRFFLFGSAWMAMPFREQCWKFLKVWPDLVQTAKEQRQRIFEVGAGAALKIEAK